MVRQERAEATRDSVLRGAAGVFLRLGYANASLSEIIAESQVTKGACTSISGPRKNSRGP